MGRIYCCRNCNKRYIGCHSTCEDYIKEKSKLDEENKYYRNLKELKYNPNITKKKGIKF